MDLPNYPESTKRIAGIVMRLFPDYTIDIIKSKYVWVYAGDLVVRLYFDDETNELTCDNALAAEAAKAAEAAIKARYINRRLYSILKVNKESCLEKGNVYFEVMLREAVLEEWNKQDVEADIESYNTNYPIFDRTNVRKAQISLIRFSTIAILFVIGIIILVASPNDSRYSCPDEDGIKYKSYEDTSSGKFGLLKEERFQNPYYNNSTRTKATDKVDILNVSSIINITELDTITPAIFDSDLRVIDYLAQTTLNDKPVVVNTKGEIIFTPKGEYEGLNMYLDHQIIPNLYAIKLYKDYTNDFIIFINDKGEKVIPYELHGNGFLHGISEKEFSYGNYIYSIDGDRRLTKTYKMRIYIITSIVIIIAVWVYTIIDYRRRRKRGEVL